MFFFLLPDSINFGRVSRRSRFVRELSRSSPSYPTPSKHATTKNETLLKLPLSGRKAEAEFLNPFMEFSPSDKLARKIIKVGKTRNYDLTDPKSKIPFSSSFYQSMVLLIRQQAECRTPRKFQPPSLRYHCH